MILNHALVAEELVVVVPGKWRIMAKKSLVNLSLDAEYLEILKEQAKVRGFEKFSDYVHDWLKKLALERKDIKRVILQVPEAAFINKLALETWLKRRSDEVVKHYFKEGDAQ
jgi:hypothetical protein